MAGVSSTGWVLVTDKSMLLREGFAVGQSGPERTTSMFDTQITVHGRLVADPVMRETASGAPMTTFRIATNARRPVNGQPNQYQDGPTSFYRVTAFSNLGCNLGVSLSKGDPVVVTGRLEISQFDRQDGTKGTAAEITARSVGHDLSWGVSSFRKVQRSSSGDGDAHHQQMRAANGAMAEAMAESAEGRTRVDVPPGVDADTGEIFEASERAA